MNGRLVTLALALGALFVAYALLGPRPSPQQDVTIPLSTEAGPNGYLGARTWLQNQGIAVESFRKRFRDLERDRTSRSPYGNLLITTMPHRLAVRAGEADALELWVRRGNTLLVLAALADTPDWSMGAGYDARLVPHVAELTGLTLFGLADPPRPAPANASVESPPTESVAEPESAPEPTPAGDRPYREPVRLAWVATGTHPLTQSVDMVVSQSEYPASRWQAYLATSGVVLSLLKLDGSDTSGVWMRQLGSGRVILSATGSPLTNKVIGSADNAQLLANIVAWSLDGEGRVLFDDGHQGLVEFYDAKAFYSDARLYRTAGWVLLLWLLFVLGSQPLRAPTPAWTPVDIGAFVKATGNFLGRVLRPTEAAGRLYTNFFNTLRARLGLVQDGEPLWEWLTAQSTLDRSQIEELRTLHARMLDGRHIRLARLHNLLNEQLERMA